MSTLFFLPWVSIKETQKFGDIQFLPYVRGSKPGNLGNITQAKIDQILGNYANHAHYPTANMAVPVETATVLSWVSDDENRTLDENEIKSRVRFGQYLVIAALSKRQYGSHFNYCNSDSVGLVVQNFELDNAAAVSFTTRRRDGCFNIILSPTRGRPYFLRPIHVSNNLKVEFDFQLLEALEKIKSTELESRIFESILMFNQANTDASEVSQDSEIVMMRAAFETLLEATHTTKVLREKFENHFKSILNSPAWHDGCYNESTWRMRWPNIKRPLDAWVNDFCDARNSGAHGKNLKSKYSPAVWSIHNHLMFSSWFFPFVLKSVLSANGYYTLSAEDKDYLTDFEILFSTDISNSIPDHALGWNAILEKLDEKELNRLIAKCLD